MRIQFDYDKKQVLQALRYHFLTRPEIKILLIIVNIFTILSAVLVYLHKIQPVSFLIFSAVWFLLILSVWIILPSNIYKKSKTFLDNFTMEFSDFNVILYTNKGVHEWLWNEFSGFMESPAFFYLYFNKRAFFLVPKDAFETLESLQETRALLKMKISK